LCAETRTVSRSVTVRSSVTANVLYATVSPHLFEAFRHRASCGRPHGLLIERVARASQAQAARCRAAFTALDALLIHVDGEGRGGHHLLRRAGLTGWRQPGVLAECPVELR